MFLSYPLTYNCVGIEPTPKKKHPRCTTQTHLKCVIEAVHSHPFPLVGLEPSQISFLGIEDAFSASCGCRAGLQMMAGMGRNVTTPMAASCAASIAATSATSVVTL